MLDLVLRPGQGQHSDSTGSCTTIVNPHRIMRHKQQQIITIEMKKKIQNCVWQKSDSRWHLTPYNTDIDCDCSSEQNYVNSTIILFKIDFFFYIILKKCNLNELILFNLFFFKEITKNDFFYKRLFTKQIQLSLQQYIIKWTFVIFYWLFLSWSVSFSLEDCN